MPLLLKEGRIERSHLSALAAKLATFHRDAESGESIAEHGRVPAVRANWDENFEQTAPYVGRTLSAQQSQSLRDYVERYLAEHADLIDERAEQHRIRDVHGDLRSDSVVFSPDGSVCVMDCIEFNERLRCGDIASDIAFLAMDLEFRGHRREADEFVSLYLEALGADETFPAVFNFYRTYRAFVRGKVESMLTGETDVPEAQRAQGAGRAIRYFALASAWAEARYPRQLMLICGLSGTGKSFIARALAARLDAALVSTDAVRRETRGGATPGPYGEGSYTTDERQHVYDEMFRRARYHLERRRSVLLDGTFLAREQRAAARKVATSAGVPWLVIQTVTSEDVVRERLEARALGDGPSDARWDTYLAQLEHFEPLNDVPAGQLVMLDSSRPLDRLVDQVTARSTQAST
jgi:predicted kinase